MASSKGLPCGTKTSLGYAQTTAICMFLVSPLQASDLQSPQKTGETTSRTFNAFEELRLLCVVPDGKLMLTWTLVLSALEEFSRQSKVNKNV